MSPREEVFEAWDRGEGSEIQREGGEGGFLPFLIGVQQQEGVPDFLPFPVASEVKEAFEGLPFLQKGIGPFGDLGFRQIREARGEGLLQAGELALRVAEFLGLLFA